MQRTFQAYLVISFGLGYWVPLGRLCRRTIRLLGNPVELRSITQQGGEAVALPLGRPRGSLPWSI